ncbi:flagellar biosynthesis protein FlhF [Paenibacillus sp. y28]|uniref:flagellar biosynthesis protein FlhF n=1 Tax=Paenibacillus sp. y28 TaxID=3129110 RepID=UPI0030173397
MRVKRYVVDSMPEAMNKIRSELGKDAVIINTKEIRVGGFMGMFAKKKIEVIAAIDAAGGASAAPAAKAPVQPKIESSAAAVSSPSLFTSREAAARSYQPAASNIPAQAATVAVEQPPVIQSQAAAAQPRPEPVFSSSSSAVSMRQEDSLSDEIRMMKQMIKQLTLMSKDFSLYPEPIEKLRQRMLDHDIAPDIAEKLCQKALQSREDAEQAWTDEQAMEALRSHLLDIVKPMGAKTLSPQTKVAHFVGPTGVGKTTTIAKLAAEQVLKHHRRVGFITSDTYRIAAVEQLKTYATILNVPLEVVFSPQELTKAFQELADCDIIFMDTAGRNFRNQMYVSELNSLLQNKGHTETFLVLSLTAKYRDMKEITENFSRFNLSKVLFTKMDETSSYGAMVNLLYDFPLQLSYVATGQNVPDDIAEVNELKLIQSILGDDQYE